MASSNLVVPVVLWGKAAPTHCISCVYLSKDQRTLITGCYDGQMCLWQVDPENLKMTPRCLLVGHTAPILCLSKASISLENNFIVSSSESGEMATWDLVDGKCCELAKLPYVHTNMQAYHMSGTDDDRLFCNGYYAEILVMDPFSLELLFSLASRVSPDWISALHVLRPAKRKDDVVLGLTTTGMVKMWPLPAGMCKGSEPLYESESKQIRCLNAISMSCCAFNQRTVLIVCAKFWQIYDAGDFSVLCSVSPPRGERWLGGEFLAADRVLLWSDDGRGYMYRLPANCIAESKDFHSKAIEGDNPLLYCQLAVPADKPLSCPPAMRFYESCQPKPGGKFQRLLIRGDSEGGIKIWDIPDVTKWQLTQIQQEEFSKPPAMPPSVETTLTAAWAAMAPPPAGILDQLDTVNVPSIRLTASIYLPQQGRLVCGREDGSIVIVPASQTVMLQLLHGKHQQYDDWPPHQVLLGHAGRVNCLLYPNHVHPRYEVAHLVSGGVDFAVCLWDLYSGALLYRFCVHAGEITQLMVPPNNCSPRVQKCVCSVASDHSVALLGLTERKCVVLASRHLFPVVTVKWRPLDDFMVVGCSDGTVHIWQMETGHLDRVLHGICGEEVLYACDEHVAASTASAGGEMGLANPAIHFFRGLRHRNLSAIRHATQRGLHQLQQLHHHSNQDGGDQQKSRAHPLVIQGLRTNPKDAESHVLFFDIEALIVQLLSEEYSAMSPGTLEAQGLINNAEYQKVAALTQSASPDAHKKIADFFGRVKDKAGDMERILKEKDKHGILAKVKEGAENVHTRLQAKAESVGFKPIHPDGRERKSSEGDGRGRRGTALSMETNLTLEVAQLLLSLVHAWGLDPDLDRVCEGKLGLLRPMLPVSFGMLSKGGYMSLLLPTWRPPMLPSEMPSGSSALAADLPPEMVYLEMATRYFTSRAHWELSTSMTTAHLLAVIALSNTLMAMNCATFVPEQERKRRMHRPGMRSFSVTSANQEELSSDEDAFTAQQAQIKQGWSLLSTLHCILLPDKLASQGSKTYKRPLVEQLARRWQDQCLEVRSAAQTLLLAELNRMGSKGRKALVDSWAPFLPFKPDKAAQAGQQNPQTQQQQPQQPQQQQPNQVQEGHAESPPTQHDEGEEEEEEGLDDLAPRRPSSHSEAKRKEATAVVLLGVIGAEFGQDIEAAATKRKASAGGEVPGRKRGSVVEGFGIAGAGNNLARCTSLALMNILLAEPTNRHPAHSAMRRAATDLIGRGFTVWEPYLDVSRVLLGLLEQCCEADKLVPSMTYGLPLTPAADACRTARNSLSLIATARPGAFITTMAREVARYNTLQQNAQALNVNLSQMVLHRAKPEILRNVELLIDKMQNEMAELLVEVMDIVLHCLDPGHLKVRGLHEVFPAVCRFQQVSHCTQTRRIAVGARSGQLALYELRSSRCQLIPAHGKPNTACAFSPDGKFLASYACNENKLCFWQTSTGMFGLGNSQTRCVKTYATAAIADVSRYNPLKLGRLIWMNNKTVSLILCDGSEARYNV